MSEVRFTNPFRDTSSSITWPPSTRLHPPPTDARSPGTSNTHHFAATSDRPPTPQSPHSDPDPLPKTPLDDAAADVARKALDLGHRILNHWLPVVLALGMRRGEGNANAVQDRFWAMQEAVTSFALEMQIARDEVFEGAVAGDVREALDRVGERGPGERGE